MGRTPEGLGTVAGGSATGSGGTGWMLPGGAREGFGLPEILWIEVDAGLFEKGEILVLECFGAVVLFLVADIGSDFIAGRRRDGESTVAFLPGEGGEAVFRFDPLGGVAFEVFDEVGEGDGGGEGEEEVDVVGDSADFGWEGVKGSEATAEVGVEFVADFWSEPGFAVLGGEDEVVMKGEMSGRHLRGDRRSDGGGREGRVEMVAGVFGAPPGSGVLADGDSGGGTTGYRMLPLWGGRRGCGRFWPPDRSESGPCLERSLPGEVFV